MEYIYIGFIGYCAGVLHNVLTILCTYIAIKEALAHESSDVMDISLQETLFTTFFRTPSSCYSQFCLAGCTVLFGTVSSSRSELFQPVCFNMCWTLVDDGHMYKTAVENGSRFEEAAASADYLLSKLVQLWHGLLDLHDSKTQVCSIGSNMSVTATQINRALQDAICTRQCVSIADRLFQTEYKLYWVYKCYPSLNWV